jgi:cytochrome oxidase assembly protein ShyY1
VVEYPTAEDLACIYPDIKVAPGMLLLAPEAEHGFVREWTQADVRFPPSRHYAYAAQWFAFGATLLFLFFKLNLKRRT